MIDEEIIDEILNDENKTLIYEDKTASGFGYDLITTQEYTSSLYPNHLVRIDYTWVSAYNNKNEFGGYNCISVVKTLEVNNS